MIAILLTLASHAHAVDIADFVDLLPDSWLSAPTKYLTTYSPCLDGLVVNFRSSGCKQIAQTPNRVGSDSLGLMCVDPTVKNGWTTIEHVIIPTESSNMRDIPEWDFLCVDPHVTMYIPEKIPGRGKLQNK